MLGQEGMKLLRELERSSWLPPFNEESLRTIIREIDELHKVIFKALADNDYKVKDAGTTCGIIVHHKSLLRNKRCALGYLNQRLLVMKKLWWDTVGVVPDKLKQALGPGEEVFLDKYDSLVGKYMDSVGINITADQTPPKDLMIQVRVLKPIGEIMFDDGPVDLELNTHHFLRRRDCELLIRQGLLEQVTDS